MAFSAPIPRDEMGRIINLSEYNLDYEALENNFKDLAKLAAKLSGTDISLVNLLDSYTQWTISYHGLEIDQMPREDSVCQYTITGDDYFEVMDLSRDERFKDKFYVVDDPSLRYYFGVPLISDGYNIGALCVLSKEAGKEISPEKSELLHIIGGEVVNRLKAYKAIETLKNKVKETDNTKRKVAHDIRGPLAGIIGLAELVSEKGDENNLDEVLQFVGMIHRSGRSLLDLADEILTSDGGDKKSLQSHELNLNLFKEKLDKLYSSAARVKNIRLSVTVSPETAELPFSKSKLLQIAGNLISNAIKFTPENGNINVRLLLATDNLQKKKLTIIVEDDGVGMNAETVNTIMHGDAQTTKGTDGEKGYGFGLALVKHLITSQHGTLNVQSTEGNGSVFTAVLPT